MDREWVLLLLSRCYSLLRKTSRRFGNRKSWNAEITRDGAGISSSNRLLERGITLLLLKQPLRETFAKRKARRSTDDNRHCMIDHTETTSWKESKPMSTSIRMLRKFEWASLFDGLHLKVRDENSMRKKKWNKSLSLLSSKKLHVPILYREFSSLLAFWEESLKSNNSRLQILNLAEEKSTGRDTPTINVGIEKYDTSSPKYERPPKSNDNEKIKENSDRKYSTRDRRIDRSSCESWRRPWSNSNTTRMWLPDWRLNMTVNFRNSIFTTLIL